MANTYTQLSVQLVFTVRGRENFIARSWRDSLHKYIAGTVRENATTLAVGGWKDHVHVFLELPPTMSVAELVQKIKANSSRWINEQRLVVGRFEWQQGYGAFSYSRGQRDVIIKYVMDQERHHATRTFQEEYLALLEEFSVAVDKRYLFEFYD